MSGVPCIATGFRQSDMDDIKKWIELIEDVCTGRGRGLARPMGGGGSPLREGL